MRLPILLLAVCFALEPAVAAETAWHSRDGKPIPDTESRKSADGFGASLVVTPDEDWETKWNTPPETVPTFSEARTVKRGGVVTILIFFANPKTDARNAANVRCDLRVLRPDGSFSINANDVVCMEGELKGNPAFVRLAAPVLKFVGEPQDPLGEWRVEVSVKDVLRQTSLHLKTSFTLEP